MRMPIRSDAFAEWRAIPGPHGWHLTPCRPFAIRLFQEAPSQFTPSAEEAIMAQCEVCGNEYYLSFEVVTAGQRHVFDSFECAIHKLAPVCSECGCKVIGHGVEANGTFYCCANCARKAGS